MKTSQLKAISLTIIALLLINTKVQSQTKEPLDIRMNYNVNLIHFIDYFSQWSPYTGDKAYKYYSNHFEVTKQDSSMLKRYAMVRKKLGYKEEIKLFNWAYNDFKLDNNSSKAYQEIKKVVEYFQNKKQFNKLLKAKFDKLNTLDPYIRKSSLQLDGIFKKNRKYLEIWTNDLNYSKYPTYFCFTLFRHHSRGGANGEGIFAEIHSHSKEKGVKKGITIAVHEFTHKLTNASEKILEFIANDSSYTERAHLFLRENHLSKEKLIDIFNSKDPRGKGNPEAQNFEESNVYFIANISVNNMSDKEIQQKIKRYHKKDQRELERNWYGAGLFKKEYEQIDQYSKNDFIWKLIEVFYRDVYFKNYKI